MEKRKRAGALMIALSLAAASILPCLRVKAQDSDLETSLRIGTYNMSCGTLHDVKELDYVSSLFTDNSLDIVGIQEVDNQTQRFPYDTLELLREKGGFADAMYNKTIDYEGGLYGTGILTREKILEKKDGDLPLCEGKGYENRRWQRVVIEKEGKKIAVYNTHLNFTENGSMEEIARSRSAQMREIKTMLDRDPIPYRIVTADWNVDQSKDEMFRFREYYQMANGFDDVWFDTVKEEGLPNRAIDNIVLTKNIRINQVKMVNSQKSDHNLLYVDCTLMEPQKFSAPQAVRFSPDEEARPGYADGTIIVDPAADERNISKYALYWGNENGRLENYRPITVVDKNNGNPITVRTVKNTYIPKEATCITAYSIGDWDGRSLSDDYVSGAIPQKQLDLGKKLYSFQVVSDYQIDTWDHLNDDPMAKNYFDNLHAALQDLGTTDPDSMAMFVVGDNVNNGRPEEYDMMNQVVDQYRDKLPPMYYSIGNHEFYYRMFSGAGWQEMIDLFKEKTGMESHYYEKIINGVRFLVLGSDEAVESGMLHREQLEWLESRLREAESFRQPVFVFLHQPLDNTVSGSHETGGKCEPYEEVVDLFSRYPQTVFFTGHTHWQLDSERAMVPGNGKMATCFNTASVGYTWYDNATEAEVEDTSEGYFVEMYEHGLLVRGRDFVVKKWIPGAQFVFDYNDNFRASAEAALEQEPAQIEDLGAYRERLEKSIRDIDEMAPDMKQSFESLRERLEARLSTLASLRLDDTIYTKQDVISVDYENTAKKDWIGVFPAGAGEQEALIRCQINGTGTWQIPLEQLKQLEFGVYRICLQRGERVLDEAEFLLGREDFRETLSKLPKDDAHLVSQKEELNRIVAEIDQVNQIQVYENVAKNKPVTGTDVNKDTNAAAVTDGRHSELSSGDYFEVGHNTSELQMENPNYVQIDLEQTYLVDKIHMWRYFDEREYKNTVILASEDEEFTQEDVVYNSDHEGGFGFGAGTDAFYPETEDGKEITFAPRNVRYIRVLCAGRTDGACHYVEIQAFAHTAHPMEKPYFLQEREEAIFLLERIAELEKNPPVPEIPEETAEPSIPDTTAEPTLPTVPDDVTEPSVSETTVPTQQGSENGPAQTGDRAQLVMTSILAGISFVSAAGLMTFQFKKKEK